MRRKRRKMFRGSTEWVGRTNVGLSELAHSNQTVIKFVHFNQFFFGLYVQYLLYAERKIQGLSCVVSVAAWTKKAWFRPRSAGLSMGPLNETKVDWVWVRVRVPSWDVRTYFGRCCSTRSDPIVLEGQNAGPLGKSVYSRAKDERERDKSVLFFRSAWVSSREETLQLFWGEALFVYQGRMF